MEDRMRDGVQDKAQDNVQDRPQDKAPGSAQDRVRQRWVCGLSYDGRHYCGWQKQPVVPGLKPSVQMTVEAALSAVAGEPVDIRCAGRTDAGVHALEQVIEFAVGVDRPTTAWVRGANAHLPDDVAMRWAVPLPPEADFDARFSARARTYWYLLIDSPVAPPLWQGRAGWTHRPLDVDAMQVAVEPLIGTHDFSSFRAAECQAASPVRTLESWRIERHGAFILMSLTANAFLHHMVRNLVGSLVYVGDGRRPSEWLAEVLAARSRQAAAPTFAAGGLYLRSVRYEPHWRLPIQEKALSLCELV
ncbi:MAG: tRNA pseudouridine(38-40) synthase TruA [Lautropia sp.]|nr:tRNA pseudouridine(38-40) synthase TruA [Lautropia sp.]